MSKNNELGQEGEQFAAEYLIKKGWEIQEMNYRYSRSEIDVIAIRNDLLIFVEVKVRSNLSYGLPEQFVDKNKAEHVMKAADHYIQDIDWKGNIRFDIISIVKGKVMQLDHIEDAFY